MKRTIKLAVVAALALGATSAFATNGSTLMGIGAKSRGMGGVGIATGMGAESGINNPALITTIKGNNEVSFGGTVFMPDIEVNQDASSFGLGTGTSETSKSDMFVIPSVSLASKINDNWYWGIGMWGTGGLGVDYRDDTTAALGATTFKMVTSLQTMQFGVPVAYTNSGFSMGVTPIIQYSALDINYNNPLAAGEPTVGAGVAQDIALGYNLGMTYETNGFTVGAVYKSEIKYNVDEVLNNALDGFGVGPTAGGVSLTEMATPAEYGVGISYKMNEHTIAVDYKNINWEDAETYQDFGWEDQDVIAVGYEYATDGWALRAGYQYAKSAVQDNTGKNLTIDTLAALGGMSSLTNTFNMLGFPGTQETHVSLGGTYVFNDTLSLDLAAVYGLENDETLVNFSGDSIQTKHSEQSYSVQVNYAF